jgi:hypothetical protein
VDLLISRMVGTVPPPRSLAGVDDERDDQPGGVDTEVLLGFTSWSLSRRLRSG